MAKKILIANRGEIAIRIAKTAKKMGFKTVGIVAPFETNYYYLNFVDEYIEMVGNNLAETFLNIEQIITIAKKSRCKYIHPGYGFLSENPLFSQQCHENSIVFIGPLPYTLELAEDKLLCKKEAIKNNINTVPFVEDIKNIENISFPVMLKARKVGGGKGLRKIYDRNNFAFELEQAQRESKLAFGDDRVFIEQLLESPKHIEAQFVRDRYDNTIFLGTRDCSVQRKNQKILEEAPAIALDESNKKNIYDWTKKIAHSLNYIGCGTVEFLYKDNILYFMEVNPRIQVEHPVTEEVTGLDIIELQIESVLGKKLSSSLENAKKNNFALELRICAEDPYNNFQGQTGYIEKIFLPGSNISGFRWDSGICEKSFISPHFDSLVGKFIVSGDSRVKTIENAKNLLSDFAIMGVQTNLSLFHSLFLDRNFLDNKIDVGYLDRNIKNLLSISKEEIALQFLVFWLNKNRHSL